MTTPIGWPTTHVECVMRQGASGTVRVRLVVLDDDGQPLPSYAGFTATLVLMRLPGRACVLSLTPSVTADAEQQMLTVDVVFTTADTLTVPEGYIGGVLCVLAPDGERNYPVSFAIDLRRAA